ncbi:MAG TPA: alpha/beta family hydrolase [Dehalococcoidia bacterium]|nr:alpha/beta family hydrolase [Dehalococcoidia bacterium]
MPAARSLRIKVGSEQTIRAVTTAARGARWWLVYAPGAGSNIDDPFGRYLADELPPHGVAVVRFQFPYQEAGRSGPDRPPVLEATWRAVLDGVRAPGVRLCAAGRSMGGRIASQVVATGERVDALALFAYPLHPPVKPEQRRDEHLPAIGVRTLFCSGTRDNFATIDELRAAAGKMKRARIHVLEGADHGFSVLKSSGRTRPEVWAEATAALMDFLKR